MFKLKEFVANLYRYLNLRHAFSQLPDETVVDSYPLVETVTRSLLIGTLAWDALEHESAVLWLRNKASSQ